MLCSCFWLLPVIDLTHEMATGSVPWVRARCAVPGHRCGVAADPDKSTCLPACLHGPPADVQDALVAAAQAGAKEGPSISSKGAGTSKDVSIYVRV
jgi:hypothetical protein